MAHPTTNQPTHFSQSAPIVAWPGNDRRTRFTHQAGSTRRRRITGDDQPLPRGRFGIAGTAYDTAWLAGLAHPRRRAARFPTALQWLVENQQHDGSWGGALPYQHDRILSTLAALPAIATFGRRAADRQSVERGTRYLWQHGHLLASEKAELVGFELLLPALIQRAQKSGIAVPPHLDIYGPQRAHKLSLIPAEALYSPRTTLVHSLEFLGRQAEPDRLRSAQAENGAIGNSPAATAFFLDQTNDTRAEAYLRHCLEYTGGATVPVLHPCETFELLWAAYHLYLAGVPAARLLQPDDQAALREALGRGGVSLAPSFPIADADDTAVALLLLNDLGETVDPSVLAAFALPEGHFASFPFERHPSVGVNLHVLHTLLYVAGYPDRQAVIGRLLDYLLDSQIDSLYWLDKWHISPYYATAHALCVLSHLPAAARERVAPAVERARLWLRQTQNPDGSWGFYGQATAEETAYAMLGLLADPAAMEPADQRRAVRAGRFLRSTDHSAHPPLWIDKCLYLPELVVTSVIESAHRALETGGRRRPAMVDGPGEKGAS